MKFIAGIILSFYASVLCATTVAIDFGPSLGAPNTGNTVLTNQLDDYGVLFSSDNPYGVIWYGGDWIYSPGRYAITNGPTDINGGGYIRIDFKYLAFNVGITGLDGGYDLDTLTLTGYDVNGSVVKSSTLTDPFLAPGKSVSINEYARIAYVIIEASDPAPPGGALYFDNLTYSHLNALNPAYVPVPSSLFLLVSGLMILFTTITRKHITDG